MKFPLKEYYSKIYRRYDFVNRLFTIGLDQRWRRITADTCLECRPEKILDLCCGTGDITIKLCQIMSSAVQVIGYDFNEQMLNLARRKAAIQKCKNAEFINPCPAHFGHDFWVPSHPSTCHHSIKANLMLQRFLKFQ